MNSTKSMVPLDRGLMTAFVAMFRVHTNPGDQKRLVFPKQRAVAQANQSGYR